MSNLVYTFDYRHDYDPPKPVIELEVSLPGRSQPKVSTVMLIDSGAKAMMAIDILQLINAKPIDHIRVLSLFGASRSTELYVVDLHIGVHHIHAVEVAALTAKEENIMGRDVLNHLVVTLNGLAGVTEIAG